MRDAVSQPSLDIEGSCLGKNILSYRSIKLLTFNRCRQTPPRPSIADPQPICHFDPLLGGFLYLAWYVLCTQWVLEV